MFVFVFTFPLALGVALGGGFSSVVVVGPLFGGSLAGMAGTDCGLADGSSDGVGEGVAYIFDVNMNEPGHSFWNHSTVLPIHLLGV